LGTLEYLCAVQWSLKWPSPSYFQSLCNSINWIKATSTVSLLSAYLFSSLAVKCKEACPGLRIPPRLVSSRSDTAFAENGSSVDVLPSSETVETGGDGGILKVALRKTTRFDPTVRCTNGTLYELRSQHALGPGHRCVLMRVRSGGVAT